MPIWSKHATLDDLNARIPGTMMEHIGIEFTEIGDDYVRGRMPVDHRTAQPFGLLHGGASATLAETLGSVSAYLCLDRDDQYPVGMEINANHVRSVRSGYVYGTCRQVHCGTSTQIWDIRITDEQDNLVCISRLTIAVLTMKQAAEGGQ